MNRQRTIVALLAAVAILLAMNLMTPGATATPAPQEEGPPTGACCVPSGNCLDNRTADECAALGGTYAGNASNCGPSVFCPPPPTVVSVTVGKDTTSTSTSYRIIRAWSDGDVDMTLVTFGPGPKTVCEVQSTCGPVSIIPLPCPEDITADGNVDVLDVIELLLAFGTACP